MTAEDLADDLARRFRESCPLPLPAPRPCLVAGAIGRGLADAAAAYRAELAQLAPALPEG